MLLYYVRYVMILTCAWMHQFAGSILVLFKLFHERWDPRCVDCSILFYVSKIVPWQVGPPLSSL